MKNKRVKKAYSLAEIMTVMLVLSVIFAACAPFLTKRKVAVRNSNAVWQSLSIISNDAYSLSGNNSNAAQLFFGVTPQGDNDVTSTYAPASKLVIRSGNVTSDGVLQRQIQFRYGHKSTSSSATDEGTFAGTWLMDGKNVLMGGRYPSININAGGARQNVGIGYDALSSVQEASSNVAIGFETLFNAINKSASYNVAVGSQAGRSTNSQYNTFLGFQTGYTNTSGTRNTFIGYRSGFYNTNASDNTYIGTLAGYTNDSASGNVAAGAGALINHYSNDSRFGYGYNVAIGYNALNSLSTQGKYNVAIGYNACSEVTTGSFKTCIGANSGPHYGSTGTGIYFDGRTDAVQRTYIGGKPKNFGGDAVLELHNPELKEIAKSGIVQYLYGTPSNATTIINGNLIVRGRLYLTSGTNLYHMSNSSEVTSLKDWYTYYGSLQADTTCATTAQAYNFTCGALNPFYSYVSSDRRLKNIGSKNTAGLDKISQLKVYNYTFKNDKNKAPHVGVMAQDLQKVFPNSVFKGKDGFLRIKWDEMFFAAINSVKELDKKIIVLANKTLKLDSAISKLEKENALLKSQVDSMTVRVNELKAQ